MRLITWNINSLRLRMPLLKQLNDQYSPDIICLQETKVDDPEFPHEEVKAAGFPHYIFLGMKSYNGVAILSKRPIERDTAFPNWLDKSDCRHIAGYVNLGSKKVLIHNFYVPAGGDIPDLKTNPKFVDKMNFLNETTKWFGENPPSSAILVGDLNIAPLPDDVWSHKQLLKVVSHTPMETEGLLKWENEGFEDLVREYIPVPEKVYTWWSYRNRDWRKSNRGRRLDHIWGTKDIVPSLKKIEVLCDYRSAERPSDHVPIVADFKED